MCTSKGEDRCGEGEREGSSGLREPVVGEKEPLQTAKGGVPDGMDYEQFGAKFRCQSAPPGPRLSAPLSARDIGPGLCPLKFPDVPCGYSLAFGEPAQAA